MDSTEPPTEPQGQSTFARKLDHLFRTVRPAGGGEHSYAEVAAGLARLGGPSVTANYIRQLRASRR
jgi:hypothetical protein